MANAALSPFEAPARAFPRILKPIRVVSPASGTIGRHAIKADRGQDKRQDPEQRREACDEPLLGKLTRDLLSQRANRNDGHAGIDGRHRLMDLRDGQVSSGPGHHDDVPQEEGAEIAARVFGLCFGQKEEGANRLGEIVR